MDKFEVIQKAEAFCRNNKLDQYPIEIIPLCNKLGLLVYEDRLPANVSGFIVAGANEIPEQYSHAFSKYRGNNYIVVNSTDSGGRKRFTIAHELAHYILHRSDDTPLYAHRDAGQNGQIEREANQFASNVLMPRKLVLEAVKSLGSFVPDSIIVECIAHDFGVSYDAAKVRLSELGIIGIS